jgi:regulatory protein NPR1
MCYLFILLEVESCVFTQLCSCYVVALARILFPTETRVAIDITQVDLDGTLELTLGSGSNPCPEIQRVTVDLYVNPYIMKDGHLTRLRALSKTGEAQFPFV